MKINKVTFFLGCLVGGMGAALVPLLLSSTKADTKLLPFQGRLTDASGNALPDGTKVVEFKIYDAPTGGIVKWAGEVHKLTVNGGLVNTMLGSKASFSGVDFSSPTYLQITVDANADGQITVADPPLLPRQTIVPAIYAMTADRLQGYQWTDFFTTATPTTAKARSALTADTATNATNSTNSTHATEADFSKGSAGLKVSAAATVNSVTVAPDGKIGVGTPNPATALDVNGTVKATGYIGDGSLLTGIPLPSVSNSPTSNYSANTSYQNTTGHKLIVVWVGVSSDNGGGWSSIKQRAMIGLTGPATHVASVYYHLSGSGFVEQSAAFIVPNGFFWQILNEADSPGNYPAGTIKRIEVWETL